MLDIFENGSLLVFYKLSIFRMRVRETLTQLTPTLVSNGENRRSLFRFVLKLLRKTVTRTDILDGTLIVVLQ